MDLLYLHISTQKLTFSFEFTLVGEDKIEMNVQDEQFSL